MYHSGSQAIMSVLTFGDYAPCIPTTFHNPTLQGASFSSIQAAHVTNYSHTGFYTNNGIADVKSASLCNVTISYTHPAQNDLVNVQVLLPSSAWNGKMQGIGGGGFAAGLYEGSFSDMAAAINQGYAAVSSDAGVDSDPKNWALLSPGNVILYLLNNLGSISLYDSAIIGKSIYQGLLWDFSEILVLERLFARRETGTHAGPNKRASRI